MNIFRAETYLRRFSYSDHVAELMGDDEMFIAAATAMYPDIESIRLDTLTVGQLLALINKPATQSLPKVTVAPGINLDAHRVIHEEVIFSGFDAGWDRELPVRLIHYGDDRTDLHRQTGESFHEHIAEASAVLALRDMRVGPLESIGSTGAYLPVTKKETIDALAA